MDGKAQAQKVEPTRQQTGKIGGKPLPSTPQKDPKAAAVRDQQATSQRAAAAMNRAGSEVGDITKDAANSNIHSTEMQLKKAELGEERYEASVQRGGGTAALNLQRDEAAAGLRNVIEHDHSTPSQSRYSSGAATPELEYDHSGSSSTSSSGLSTPGLEHDSSALRPMHNLPSKPTGNTFEVVDAAFEHNKIAAENRGPDRD
jgi:hypothetical protein